VAELALFKQGLETPLSGQSFSTDGVVISECPPCGKVNVRANFDNTDVVSVIAASVGQSSDVAANTWVENEQCALYWLGPDERLFHTSGEMANSLVDTLQAKLEGCHSAVVDVSDYYTVIRVAGEKARAVLASGTPFDLHPRVFGSGCCAQTRIGSSSVLLSLQNETGPVYDLQVRWSFAGYLWRYLCRVARYV